MQEVVTLDLTIPASECMGFCKVTKDFVRLENLKEEDDSAGLKRRIIAVTEGTHNGLQFRAKEIKAMVQRAQEIKDREGRKYFKIPLVLDHSYRFIDKVGATYNLQVGKDPVKNIPAAIADVVFWNSTPMLQEVTARVRQDPENTFFSVRVRGKVKIRP